MILLECHLDLHLLEYLGYKHPTHIVHSGGKGNVLKGMSKFDISLGIVDDDENTNNHPRLNDYTEVINEHNLRLLENKDIDSRKLILIPKDLENWLHHLANQTGCKTELSKILNRSGNIKKRYKNNDMKKLYEFFDCIKSNPGFERFRRWVTEYSQFSPNNNS